MLERALRLLRGSVEAVSGTGRGKNYILVRIRVVDDELGIARDHTFRPLPANVINCRNQAISLIEGVLSVIAMFQQFGLFHAIA